jgi:hypothetical protein
VERVLDLVLGDLAHSVTSYKTVVRFHNDISPLVSSFCLKNKESIDSKKDAFAKKER